MSWKTDRIVMAGKNDEIWDSNNERESIHVYVECEETDGYDDELDIEEEVILDLSSFAPTDEWYDNFPFSTLS